MTCLHFPWKLPHFRERGKVAGTFWQCTFSFDNLLFFFDFGSGDCSGGPHVAEMAFWLCTFVGAH